MQSKTRLVFIDGTSRKFWNATLTGDSLLTQWGRIGTDGQTKTADFKGDEAKAQAAYEKAVREKRAKGYTDADGDAPLDSVASAISVPTIRPMLADEVPLSDVAALIANTTHHADQKFDGDRICLSIDDDGNVAVLGRSGQASKHTPLFTSDPHKTELARLRGVTLDGELVVDTFHVFDMPQRSSLGIEPESPYWQRRAALEGLYLGWSPDPSLFALVRTATNPEEKQALYDSCVLNGAEGVMFKDVQGAYEPGRRVAHMVKAKFVNEADVVVTSNSGDGKDSYSLHVYDADGAEVPMGNCSAIGKDACKDGDVIVVRYLYRGANGKLVQARMLRRRTDKLAAECSVSQFVGKDVNKAVVA